LETISKERGKIMRLELIFLAVLLTLIYMASGIETEDIGPQIGTTIPLNAQINASEVQIQNSIIGSNVSFAVFSLNWQNIGSDLEMTLISPSGGQINQSAQMPIVYTKEEINAYYTVPNPEPGNWTAIIEAKNVSSKGEEYVFFAAQVLGDVTVGDDEMESSADLSNSINQTNSTNT
jgi:hypothetical protein